jgi:hypothetical protein
MVHEGLTFDIELGKRYNYDQGGYHTWNEVLITERSTGKTFKRIGDGRQIGNFHPIWVNWKGEKITLEELLRR